MIFPVDVSEYPNSEMASLYISYICSEGSRNKITFSSPNYLREINLHVFLFYRVVEIIFLAKYINNSERQFKDFKNVENKIQQVTCPFSFEVIKVPDNHPVEISDLQSH